MGTNYYVHINECWECGRWEELHVGTSGTCVQAHVRPAWSADDPTPIGEIRSWADWRKLLAEVDHTCWDEYGARLTTSELIAIFEGSDPAARRRQYDWMIAHREPMSHDWLDADGFSVTAVEFS